jgi:hypothetical protein
MSLVHAILIAISLAVAAPAIAQERLVAQSDAVMSILRAKGLKTHRQDANAILSSDGGTSFAVLFDGCKKGRDCRVIQFYAGWGKYRGTTLARLNEWNRANTSTRALLDDEQDPVLEMNVDLDGQKEFPKFFEAKLALWRQQLKTFKAFTGIP